MSSGGGKLYPPQCSAGWEKSRQRHGARCSSSSFLVSHGSSVIQCALCLERMILIEGTEATLHFVLFAALNEFFFKFMKSRVHSSQGCEKYKEKRSGLFLVGVPG